MSQKISFSLVDLAISLMVIFILLFVSVLHNMGQTAQSTREQLVRALKGQQIDVEVVPGDASAVKSIIPEDKLRFAHNKSLLQPAGKEFLDSFIVAEAQAVCDGKIRGKIQSIQIIGYTNSLGNDEHNLKLSQERAFSVMMYALHNPYLSADKKECLFDLITVNGRGERDLIRKPDGTEDFQASRRVEIIYRIKSSLELQN